MLSSARSACIRPERVLSDVGGMRDHCRMRDGDDEQRRRAIGPPTAGADDERDLDTPNCPDCLSRMEAEESASGEPYWACTECGLVALA